MQAKKQLRTLKPYQPGKPIEEVKREYGLTSIVKLASNENPYGCSPFVKEAMMSEMNRLPLYPDGYALEVREKLSSFLNVRKEQLIFGNGSDEVIQLLCRTYLTKDTNTVMATPTFSQYRHNATIEGAEIREVPLKNGYHDLVGMAGAIDDRTRIIWLCNPNNPSGTYIREQDFEKLMASVPSNVIVVCDEAYHEYVQAKDYPQTISYLNEYPNLVILRTFSKAYGLAALRIGYGIANESIISAMEPAREPFNTSRIAQKAAMAAIGDQAFIEECFRKNRKGLQQYYDFCSKNGLTYYPSETNFILIDMGVSGDAVFQYLLERGYIIRSGTPLGFPTCVRITVGSKEQNDGIIHLLERFLSER